MTSPREADQVKESKSLSVSEVDAGLDGTVAARIKDSDTDTYVWFKLPDGHRPHPDLIASAFAAVFGNFYDEWIYSAPISESAAQRLEGATQSRWTVSGRKIEPYAPGRETLLNFSGGFDSLAAAALLKGHSRLVSIDFGARFEREKRFFERFDSAVVATNVRGLEKSWTFMGAPSILLADYFSAGYISFGSILEASPWNFVARRGVRRSHPVFEAIGLIETNPLVGLTEFSSARLALSSQPDLVVDSLVSLADQHTEKYLRKSLLLSAAADKEGIHELPLAPAPTQQEPVDYGAGFSSDFLAPGLWKWVQGAQSWMHRPAGFEKWSAEKSLDFYWAELPGVSAHPEQEVESSIRELKRSYGIRPYSTSDWDDFRSVVDILKFFHPIPGPTWQGSAEDVR